MLQPEEILPRRVRALARERPSQPAIVDATGGSVTYTELDERMRAWTSAFQRLGVEPGQTVVTMLPNSIEAYAVWLGAGWLRAIEVPINNDYRGRMLRYVVNNAEARTVVVASDYLNRFIEVADELEHVETVVVVGRIDSDSATSFRCVGVGALLDGSGDAHELPGPLEDDIGAIIYTSGTTGPSKGVMVPWAHWFWFVQAYAEGYLSEGENFYSTYPPFHTSGKSMFSLAALRRTTLVIREKFSVSNFWDDIRSHDIRCTALIGPTATMLLEAEPRSDDADNPLTRMSIAPVIPRVHEFMERFGVEKFCTVYGMTEIGLPIGSDWGPPNLETCGRVRSGRPGYELRVVDEHDHPVEPNVMGELVVRSAEPWVMNVGYWGMPEATARAWRNGWYHTGDGFRMDEDGWLYFVDRVKDALRRRGENISSFEVEAAVSEHPDVKACAVIGVPSELGEDEVKAVVVREPESELEAEELVEFLIPRMPDFMVPRYVEFIEDLPRTDATQRTRKVVLREDPVNERTWDREQSRLRTRKASA